jgi:predicted metal-dependent hydrolase
MTFDWNSGPLAEGLQCYRSERFWHAHEHWEEVWLKCEEPDKAFLQALIQITAAFHHFQRNEISGMESLLRKALRRLEAYPEEFGGVAVAVLRDSVRSWLSALDLDAPPNLPIPPIV